MPNLNQSLFGSDNALGATKASNKNIAETITAHKWSPCESAKGYKATIKNMIEKITPKDFSDPIFISTCCLYINKINGGR